MRLQHTYHLIFLLYRGGRLFNIYQKNRKFQFGLEM